MRYYSSEKISEIEKSGKDKEYIGLLRIIHDDVEGICEEIKVAFGDVQLGGGIGLSQANAMDDYEPEDVLQHRREEDEKNDWHCIKIEDLNNNTCGLSYFDAEGMRFHLPAYMIAHLREQYNFDLLGVVVDTSGSMYEKFQLFSSKQKRAIISYLDYISSTEDAQFDRGAITRSIDGFWRRDI